MITTVPAKIQAALKFLALIKWVRQWRSLRDLENQRLNSQATQKDLVALTGSDLFLLIETYMFFHVRLI